MANELILCVDDEAHILELLTFNLEASGYRVVTAENGEDALAQKTVLGYLKSNGQTLHISYSKHILSRDGVDSRGFLGIGACFSFQRWTAGHVVGT